MVSAQFLAGLGFVVLLLSTPLSILTLLGLSALAISLSLWQLRSNLGVSEASRSESVKDVYEKMKHLKATNRDLDSGLKVLLSCCTELLCIYSEDCVQICSAGFERVSHSAPSFWTDRLLEEHQEAFATCITHVLKGQKETLRVRLKPFPSSILPLSPLLGSEQDWKDGDWNLLLQPFRYQGQAAVLISVQSDKDSGPVRDFVKTFNHEFRTPLNVIIGLSDLIMCEEQGRSELFTHRQTLIRQCAYTLLATVSSIIQQCELEWKVPTGLNHAAFDPCIELQAASLSIQDKLQVRGNSLRLVLDPAIPVSLWGNVTQFRHVISFLAVTVSNITNDDDICIRISAQNHQNRSDLQGDIAATCPAVCSRADFNSILQVFTAPTEEEAAELTSIIRVAEQQAMLNLSVAREMCKLLFGDLEVTDCSQLHLHFSMSFSTRAQYVLKRKGNICSDSEEFVRVEAPAYLHDKEDSFDLDTSHSGISRFKSDSNVLYLQRREQPESRRAHTVPTHGTTLNRPPFNRGDTGDTPLLDQIHAETFALVADDVSMNATVLCQMLERLDVSSAVVGNGAEALNFLQTHKADMIFMDCEMPVMDGLEATRRMREMGVRVPIVAVTANGPEKEDECREAGMDYFMSKPVRFAGLAALLDRLQASK